MRDWHLIAVVFIFVMVDVIMLVIITAIGNARFTVATIPDAEHPGEFTDVSQSLIFILITIMSNFSKKAFL